MPSSTEVQLLPAVPQKTCACAVPARQTVTSKEAKSRAIIGDTPWFAHGRDAGADHALAARRPPQLNPPFVHFALGPRFRADEREGFRRHMLPLVLRSSRRLRLEGCAAATDPGFTRRSALISAQVGYSRLAVLRDALRSLSSGGASRRPVGNTPQHEEIFCVCGVGLVTPISYRLAGSHHGR